MATEDFFFLVINIIFLKFHSAMNEHIYTHKQVLQILQTAFLLHTTVIILINGKVYGFPLFL